ncbi:HpcH/HpaI aldolase/citrate lyase family protein [Sphingomonas nostoxanthinifaciens]|uniref:HpcH/HpaI aldolase/citrate lyase family protein n=1 Tax=Sphingomonas nostoxanthinifaciens TaxID=2872652 RepID=UPI001CC1DD39|nr:CoA ester lyase [Sphingomonas nostoxanthinifaciens]UAK22974.1 CoA ester lyase [Sphingomonas nostoxanthinifaciens]
MTHIAPIRSALFLPASNARAVAKARTLACDLVILDLEDAVAEGDKAEARAAAVAASNENWGDRLLAVRLNGAESNWHDADLAAVARLPGLDLIVLPKVDDPLAVRHVGERAGMPILAMIETAAGVYAARQIAAEHAVAGLIAGVNDLAAALRIPVGAGRAALEPSLHLILLAARAAGKLALDGVYNRLDDAEGFAADARAGQRAGFDGKSLIHPDQIEPCNRLFVPSEADIEEARALVAAATGGAERFRGRMIETLHVDSARTLLARADVA